MSDARDRMVLDFTKKISERLQDVLQLEMDLARAVFTGPECLAIMLEVAAGMQCGAILYAVQASKEGTDPDFMFRTVSGAIAARVEQQRHLLPKVIAEVERRRAGMPHRRRDA